MNNQPDDIEYILPFGDKLRELLAQSFITGPDLRHLLRGRGVFVSSTDKTALIPIMTATLLSPTEFDYLCECWVEKEDNLKVSTDIVPLVGGTSLMELLPDDIEVSSCVKTEFKNFSVIGSPSFAVARPDADEQDLSGGDAVLLQFQIQRNDLAKNWISIEKKYSGWLELARIDDSHIRLTTTYTSQETLDVANGVKSRLINHFRATQAIPNGAAIQSVTFASFDNKQRVDFLLSLTQRLHAGWLEFSDLVDMEIRPDESEPLPQNMYWMADKIREMRMKGQSLHTIFILKDPACHPFVQLFQIEARFNFTISLGAGQCIISMGFPSWRDSHAAPMVINVTSITLDHECRHVPKPRIRRELLARIEALKIKVYGTFQRGINSTLSN